MNCSLVAESSTSTKLKKTNSKREYNYSNILGWPTSRGIIPIIFRIQLRAKDDCKPGCGPYGVRGIVHFGNTKIDRLDRCDVPKQVRHDVNCVKRFCQKFDGIESHYDECRREGSFCRKKGIGIFNLPYKRTYYNATTMYKAPYKLRQCNSSNCCYSYNNYETPEIVEEKYDACEEYRKAIKEKKSPTPTPAKVKKETYTVNSKMPTSKKKVKKTGCSTCGRF